MRPPAKGVVVRSYLSLPFQKPSLFDSSKYQSSLSLAEFEQSGLSANIIPKKMRASTGRKWALRQKTIWIRFCIMSFQLETAGFNQVFSSKFKLERI